MANLSIRTESFGGSDDRWLGSREGLDTARSVTLDDAGFPAGTYPNGVVKSGTPLGRTDAGTYIPYDPNATVTSGTTTSPAPHSVLRGFLATDQSVANGDAVAPMIDRGRIRTRFLPVAFTAPTGSSRFVFVS